MAACGPQHNPLICWESSNYSSKPLECAVLSFWIKLLRYRDMKGKAERATVDKRQPKTERERQVIIRCRVGVFARRKLEITTRLEVESLSLFSPSFSQFSSCSSSLICLSHEMQSFYINSSTVRSIISLFFSFHITFDVQGSGISSEEQLALDYRMYNYILEWAENISQNVLSN